MSEQVRISSKQFSIQNKSLKGIVDAAMAHKV